MNLIFCLALGFRIENTALLPVAFAWMFFIAVFCASIGTVIGSLLEDIQSFQLMMNFFIMPFFLFSNALFPLDRLPQGMRTIVSLNPLSHGIDGLRGSLTHGFFFGAGADLCVLGIFTAILFILASYLFSLIEP